MPTSTKRTAEHYAALASADINAHQDELQAIADDATAPEPCREYARHKAIAIWYRLNGETDTARMHEDAADTIYTHHIPKPHHW